MSRDHGSEKKVQTDFWKALPRWIPASLGLAVIVGLKCVEARGLIANTAVLDQPYH